MSIAKNSIPEELRSDRNVSPYIHRAIELENVEPIISYFNKIYVLEYILNNKIHTRSKSNEEFTIKLLDDTESMKKDTTDEGLHTVLNDKNLSFRYVVKFAYSLFNSCLESLKFYNADNKAQMISKFRAAMCFLIVLDAFESSSDSIDFAAIFGPKIKDWNDFKAVNKEKLKVLKYQLTRLAKDEVQLEEGVQSTNADLERELEEELNKLSTDQGDERFEKGTTERIESEEEDDDITLDAKATPKNPSSSDNPIKDDSIENESHQVDTSNAATAVYRGLSQNTSDLNLDNIGTDDMNLPGAPHFTPDEGSDSEGVKLPHAPKYLPTDDLAGINKSGSIQVFAPNSPEGDTKSVTESAKQASVKMTRPAHHEKPLSKENIKEILNRDDVVVQIQKHTKFANSALQFEDFNEAENQLLKGLELLRALKRQEEE